MNKVLIQDGLVHEIFGEVAPELHPDLLVVDAPTDVEAGYSYADGVFTAPEAPDATEQANMEARIYLAETDWYVVRKFETGKAIPQEVLVKRAEARVAIVNT